jgi:hypothetical protein
LDVYCYGKQHKNKYIRALYVALFVRLKADFTASISGICFQHQGHVRPKYHSPAKLTLNIYAIGEAVHYEIFCILLSVSLSLVQMFPQLRVSAILKNSVKR